MVRNIGFIIERIDEYRRGKEEWDPEKNKFIQLSPRHPGLLSQEMRKKFLGDIDGYDVSFLSDQFHECPCEELGRQPGFISFRDLAETKIANMIIEALKKTDFVRYISVGSGGYYFDYRMLRRVCLASKELKKKKATLEVFFIDPYAPLILDIEKLLQQPQYTCKNLELKLRTANIELKDFPEKFCPTIIGSMDAYPVVILSEVIPLFEKCRDSVKGVLLVGSGVVEGEDMPQINFFTLVARQNKGRFKQLEKDGYEKHEYHLCKREDYFDNDGQKKTGYTACLPEYCEVYVKKFSFNEDGLKKFKDELEDAGMILSGDEKFLQKIDDFMNK